MQNRRKSRELFLEEITITPIVDRRGGISNYLGEICELEPTRPLRGPFSTTGDSAERVGLISGGVGHELNNVLTGILGNCSLALHADDVGEGSRRRVASIHALGCRLAGFSRKLSLCSGPRLLHAGAIELNRAVTLALDALEPVVSLAPVMTVLSADPVVIHGEGALLELAVAELVRNALDACEATEEDIFVSVQQGEWEGRAFGEEVLSVDFGLRRGAAGLIRVLDYGCGMERALLEIAPELFVSAKRAHAGLGLAVVLGIVKSHGGAFELRSAPGRGCEARLYFPLATQAPR